jgi:hypothetical protein
MSYVKPNQLIDDIIHSGVLKSNLTIKQMAVRGTLAGRFSARRRPSH